MSKLHWPLPIVVIHWLTFLIVAGLFGVGFYMVELDYYDSLYRVLPHWHKSVGLLLFALTLIRICHRTMVKGPDALDSISSFQHVVAKGVHLALYGLLLTVFVSGYLISTADGRSIDVFTWFSVPSVISDIDNLEDIAGEVHYWSTYGLIGLAVLHGAAALKHHFIDKDAVLTRMFGRTRSH